MVWTGWALLILASIPAPQRLAEAHRQSMAGNYVASENVLRTLGNTSAADKDYQFLRFLNAFGLNHRSDAVKASKNLEWTFDELAPRHQALVRLMRADLAAWKDDDLGDISRDMRVVGDRLRNGMAGPKTQHHQQVVKEKLDRLIDQLEQKEKGDGQAADKDVNGQPARGQVGPPKGPPKPGDKPMDDSRIAQQGGPGKINDQALKEIAQRWGQLPEKERAKAMMELSRGLPPRYREIIENYAKSLAREQPKAVTSKPE